MSQQINEGLVRDFRGALRKHPDTGTLAETLRESCGTVDIQLTFSPQELMRLTELLDNAAELAESYDRRDW